MCVLPRDLWLAVCSWAEGPAVPIPSPGRGDPHTSPCAVQSAPLAGCQPRVCVPVGLALRFSPVVSVVFPPTHTFNFLCFFSGSQ